MFVLELTNNPYLPGMLDGLTFEIGFIDVMAYDMKYEILGVSNMTYHIYYHANTQSMMNSI